MRATVIRIVAWADPASAVASYARSFQAYVADPLNEKFATPDLTIAHLGLDGYDELTGSIGATQRLFTVVHDPDRIVGHPDWRPVQFTPAYCRWRATAARRRRSAIRLVERQSVAIVVTSQAALHIRPTFTAIDYVSPVGQIGPMIGSAKLKIGVLGHLHPGRKLESLVGLIGVNSGVAWRIVGRSQDPRFAQGLQQLLGPDAMVLPNLSDEELASETASWRALCVPPSRTANHAASQSVADALAAGMPVLYPAGAKVIAEYVGQGGICYGSSSASSFTETIEDLLANEDELRAAALHSAERLGWGQSLETWTKILGLS